MQELVAGVCRALPKPWNAGRGRRRALGLYRAVEVACMYLRHNTTQELLADLIGVSQATVSRIVAILVPVIRSVLAEYVPDAADAIAMVEGRVVLVDGTITPCWSYAEHPDLWSRKKGTTGFNAQLVSLLDGSPIYISEPLPGCTHDAVAFTRTRLADIIQHSGGAIADKGYQGHVAATPRKVPRKGALSKRDKECNAEISALRSPIERVVAHFKSWRILHTDYRRPYRTYRDTYDAVRGLFFFSMLFRFE